MQDVAFPRGFSAAGTACGIKKNGRPDAGLLASEPPARAFGAFTRNTAAAAPVRLCREVLAKGKSVSHILVNSGNANAATGERGYRDALASVAQLRAACRVDGERTVFAVTTSPLPSTLKVEASSYQGM
jgi:glutamate N-acetyltransferase/amino-acid N-acetyltransferase